MSPKATSAPRRPIALVTAQVAHALDEDLPPLIAAFHAVNIEADAVSWDDPMVDWGRYELALLRSTWDYPRRMVEFLAWVDQTASVTTLINPAAMVRWNTDKHYLAELAAAGVPIVPSVFLEPGDNIPKQLSEFLADRICTNTTDITIVLPFTEFVVKPAIGAGSQDAQRYSTHNIDTAAARSHVARLHAAGRSVMLQPYLDRVDEYGETALIFLAGQFSHAVRKGALLPRGAGATPDLFAAEQISSCTPDNAELCVAAQALAAMPFDMPLYARVDLIRDATHSPCVLELELTEPSLYFGYNKNAAARYATVVLEILASQLPAIRLVE